MEKHLITGLIGIVLTGTSLTTNAQREYIQGNIHDIDYKLTTEKEFPKYKFEVQTIFNEKYTFWQHFPNCNELNFSLSKQEKQSINFEIGGAVSIESKRYVPVKKLDELYITGLEIDKRFEGKIKSKQDFGYSFDLTDKDLEFNIPEIEFQGVSYMVLKSVDNLKKHEELPLYLIPKVKGVKIKILGNNFMKEGHSIQGKIIGNIYTPKLISEKKEINYSQPNYPTGIPEIKPNKKPETNYYIIKKGDTFYGISKKIFGNPKYASKIQKLNPKTNPKKLQIGQKIIIPKN